MGLDDEDTTDSALQMMLQSLEVNKSVTLCATESYLLMLVVRVMCVLCMCAVCFKVRLNSNWSPSCSP